MAGKAGRSGRSVGIKKILRACEKLVEDRAQEIVTAYINKAVQGDSACLVDLANRLMGKSKDQLDIKVRGELSADQVALIYRKAYEEFQEIKQLENGSSNNQE